MKASLHWLFVLVVIQFMNPNRAVCETKTLELSSENGKWGFTKKPEAVTPKDNLEVRILGFNFMKFNIAVTTEEEAIPGFDYLAQLWAPLLGPGGVAMLDSAGKLPASILLADEAEPYSVLVAAQEVYGKAGSLDKLLIKTMSTYHGTGIGSTERTALKKERDDIAADAKVLDQAHETLQKAIVASPDAYGAAFGRLRGAVEAAEHAYRSTREKAERFSRLADKSMTPFVESFENQAAGTRVTVRITSTDAQGVQKLLKSYSFTVRAGTLSSFVLHGGYFFTGLDRRVFEKVQRIQAPGAQDVFLRTEDEGDMDGVALFLSLPIFKVETKNDREDMIGMHATVGTEVGSPGETVFAGLSLQLGRGLVSVGWALSEVEEGKGELEAGLFERIEKTDETALFVSLTVALQ